MGPEMKAIIGGEVSECGNSQRKDYAHLVVAVLLNIVFNVLFHLFLYFCFVFEC
jgi:hypothetical protein